MVRRRRFLRALVARTGTAGVGAALCLPLGLGLTGGLTASLAPGLAGAPAAAAAPGATASSAATPAEPDTSPLRVRISSMSKSSLPAHGRVRITGTVTNRSDVTWTTINLYTFAGTDDTTPMTTPADLDAAMDVPYDVGVGGRQVNVGEEPGNIDVLAPGETAPYRLTVPVSALPMPAAGPATGVYWFGVHALGQGGSEPRDDVADGRARTFLPYVPRRTEPVPATLVVPLTHALFFDSDGSVADEEGWAQRLGPGGRLHDLLALGRAGLDEGVPITWLVDPALVDVVDQLARGNPPRSLSPTPGPGDGGDGADGGEDPGPSGTPDAGGGTSVPSPTADPDAEPLPDSPAAVAARDWLETAADVLARGDVRTLPYGNPDVAATQSADPGLLDLALAQRSTALADLGTEGMPLLAAPDGYVDLDLVAASPDDRPMLVGDRFLDPPTPAVAQLDGHQLVVASSGAAEGSPGPGRSVTAVGLRQRILAEAAVRTEPTTPGPSAAGADPITGAGPDPASASGEPLVVLLPTTWDLSRAEEFFDGLEPDWITFGALAATTGSVPGAEITEDDLVDPAAPAADAADPATDADPTTDPATDAPTEPGGGTPAPGPREIQPATVEAVQGLIDAGDTLQRLLVENTEVGARVTEQALSGLSYAMRRQQRVARASLDLSHAWIDARLGQVQLTAPSGVTLSGDSGTFVVTLKNNLEEPVRVSIAASNAPGVTIEQIEPIELGASSRTSVLLNVTTTTTRVNRVTLMVTDAEGVPLGATEQVPIRSVLVSGVIWVIIGVGVGTLFLAIGLRLARRIRAARRGEPAPR